MSEYVFICSKSEQYNAFGLMFACSLVIYAFMILSLEEQMSVAKEKLFAGISFAPVCFELKLLS